MDSNDLSLSSGEDQADIESNLNSMETSESDHDGNGFRTFNDEIQQSNELLSQSGDESKNGHLVTDMSSRNDPPDVEDYSSDCDSTVSNSKTSSIAIKERFEASLSAISAASTDAICGSSPNSFLDDDLIDDQDSNIEESMDSLEAENGNFPLTSNVANSLNTTSVAGVESFVDRTCAVRDGSSLFQAGASSLKLPETPPCLDIVDKLSENSEETSKKDAPTSNMASNESRNAEMSLSIKENESPLLPRLNSNNARENETSENILGNSHTEQLHGVDCKSKNDSQKEDKSVRRKIKNESVALAETSTPSTISSADPSLSTIKSIGLSLLHIANSLEVSLSEAEIRGRTAATSHLEYFSFSGQNNDVEDNTRLDTESVLKQVHDFFQLSSVEADENLSWEENKNRIIASNFFSEDFKKVLDLVQAGSGDLDISFLSSMRQQELCLLLTKCEISERDFINYVKCRINEESPEELNRNHTLTWIQNEFGLAAMIKLYNRLQSERATFHEIFHSQLEIRELSQDLESSDKATNSK